MNLTSAGVIKKLCEKYEIRPSKKWGQNFLIDRNILEKILEAADLKKSDIALEVGPGFGVLTQELAERVKKVYAVEIDKRLVGAIEETLSCKNVKIINEDILKIDIDKLRLKKFKVVANLPYQITSAVIRKFLELSHSPSLVILMVQKEVAERICSKPGDMSLLSVSVQFYGKPEIVSRVSRNSFWPVPNVDSAILKITPHSNTTLDPKRFFEIVRARFSKPRKQLQNNLEIESSVLKKAGLNEKIRAEELSVEDWIRLIKLLG